MSSTCMTLRVLLPFGIFAEQTDVTRVLVDTAAGSFGFLPHRLDGVAAIVPGILVYTTDAQGENFLAVDEGVLVKTGTDVTVSVRRAVHGSDLAQLRASVEREFQNQDTQAQDLRQVMAKLETGFLRRFASFQHE
jgi:F-type H+-transporting ATPase subunit epsilon